MRTLIFTDENDAEIVISTSETVTITEIGKQRSMHRVFASTEELEAHLQDHYFWPTERVETVGDRRQYTVGFPIWLDSKHYTAHLRHSSGRIYYFLGADKAFGHNCHFSGAGELTSPEHHRAFVQHHNASVRPRSQVCVGGEDLQSDARTEGLIGSIAR